METYQRNKYKFQNQEMGHIDLRELQQYEGPLGIGLERELWGIPTGLQELNRPRTHQLAARKRR